MALPPGPSTSAIETLIRWLYRPLEFLDSCHRRYGDAFSMRLSGLPAITVVAHPDAVKDVFSGGNDVMMAGKMNRTLGPFLGPNSLLLLDGAAHLSQRRLVLPPFHGERMASYGELMLDETDRSIDAWPVGSPFALHPHTQQITLRVILRAVFGIEDPARMDERATVIKELLEVGAWAPLLVPWFQRDLGPWSPWGKFVRLSERADRMLYADLAARRASGRTGTDILSLLLSARHEDGAPMSDQEIRDQLVTLLVAGHETTATALAWSVRWMARTPGLWDRLEAEVATAWSGDRLVPERVAKLALLDATVRETLRLQPVVPMVGRYLDKDARVGGLDLPAGTAVLPSIYLAQRRAETYPDPERFDPERFLSGKLSPYEWFPFGGGVRRCVGMAFAIYEMKMVLAAIVLRTRLTLEPGVAVRAVRRSVTLSPSGGLPVVAVRRASRRASA